jgi:signal transduction histidine kinase
MHRPRTVGEPTSLKTLEVVGSSVVVALLAWGTIREWPQLQEAMWELLPWLVLVASADLLPVPVWGSVQLMMSFPVLLAAAFVFPPYMAGLISFVGTVDIRELRGEISLLRGLLNRSNVAASILVASFVFHSLTPGAPQWPAVVVFAFAALVADFLVNWTLVMIGTHLLTGVGYGDLVRNFYGGSRPGVFFAEYACFGLLALLMAVVYSTAGSWGLAVFVIPLLLGRQVFVQGKDLGEASVEIAEKERAFSVATSQMANERKEERLAIAAGIHDEVLPPLYKVHLMGQVLRHDLDCGRLLDLEADVPDLLRAVEAADSALRDMIRDLRDSTIGPGGLAETIRLLVRQLEADGSPPIDTELHEVGGTELTQHLAYQLMREAVSNAVKHADAKRIRIVLSGDESSIQVQVSDDGRGFNPHAVDRSSHFGLALMSERAQLAGGSVHVESSPGKGTEVRASLPVDGGSKRD